MCGTEAASDLRGGFFGGVRCKVGGRAEASAPTEAIQEVRLARRRVREPRPYGGYKSCGTAGRCGHRPLRNRIMGCVGEGLCPSHGRGRTPPLRRVTRSAVKRGVEDAAPYGGVTRSACVRDDVGSELSAASGRSSEVSEWLRSKFPASAVRQHRNFGHRNRVIVPYGGLQEVR